MSRSGGFLLVAVAGLGLLGGAAAARRGASREPSLPRAADREAPEPGAPPVGAAPSARRTVDPRKVGVPAPSRPEPSRRNDDEEFWDDLSKVLEERRLIDPAAYQERTAAITAGYLGLEPAPAAAFKATTAVVRTELQQAWASRDDALLRLPDWLGAGERSEREAKIQERYEDAKRQALGRVEALLGDGPRDRRFRSKLDEWIDAVR